MKHIEWKKGKEIKIELVKEIEQLWNIKFPKAYVEIMQKCDGGRPKIKNASGFLFLGVYRRKNIILSNLYCTKNKRPTTKLSFNSVKTKFYSWP